MDVLYVVKLDTPFVEEDIIMKVKPYRRTYYESLGNGYVFVKKGTLTGAQLLQILNTGKISYAHFHADADPTLFDLSQLVSNLEKIGTLLRTTRITPVEEEVEDFEFETTTAIDVSWKEIKYGALEDALKEYSVVASIDIDVEYEEKTYAVRGVSYPIRPEDEFLVAKRYPPFAVIKTDGNKKLLASKRELDRELQRDPLATVVLNLAGKWIPATIFGTEFGTGKILITRGGKDGFAILVDSKSGEIQVLRGKMKMITNKEAPLISLDLVTFLPSE